MSKKNRLNLMLKQMVDSIMKPYLNANFMAKKALSENAIKNPPLKKYQRQSFGLFQLTCEMKLGIFLFMMDSWMLMK